LRGKSKEEYLGLRKKIKYGGLKTMKNWTHWESTKI